jgi:predicted aldo/keto reductase-like oxidoreductase
MGSAVSKIFYIGQVLTGMGARILFGWSPTAYNRIEEGSNKSTAETIPLPTFFSNDKVLSAIKSVLNKDNRGKNLSDEAVIKICRQIEFWYTKGEVTNASDLADIAQTLLQQSMWCIDDSDEAEKELFKVPSVRFGKTNIQIPIVTCGGMRLQNTWLPDSIPLLAPNRKKVLASSPQENIKNCIRSCLSVGINHFETARMYGTSEYQIVDALVEMMNSNEIKREDFIFQTKIVSMTSSNFQKAWDQSWDNCKALGYIDLFSLHAIIDYGDTVKESMEIVNKLRKEGKIRHVGFSTHGTADQIMAIINTEQFDYINLHYHFFGSYHGSGTSDTLGGEGNYACVQRARELDMGVFQISPMDKGGKLYRPSTTCATLVGKDMTPCGFALLYAWTKGGIDTSSVGIARPSDLDEVMGAIRIMNLAKISKVDLESLLDTAISRLNDRAEEELGKEWIEKGLMNLPSCNDKSTDGVFIGHILWIYNILTIYGMYDFCRDRYSSLIGCAWNNKKTFEENIAKMNPANQGRAYDESVDLRKALESHYNPELALTRIQHAHKWLSGDDPMSDDELSKMGWNKGYNLSTWEEMPGAIDSRDLAPFFEQVLTGGRMGFKSGPSQCFKNEAIQLRRELEK